METVLIILMLAAILSAVGAAFLGAKQNLPVKVLLILWVLGTVVLTFAFLLIVFVIIPLVILAVAFLLTLVVIAAIFAISFYVWRKFRSSAHT